MFDDLIYDNKKGIRKKKEITCDSGGPGLGDEVSGISGSTNGCSEPKPLESISSNPNSKTIKPRKKKA